MMALIVYINKYLSEYCIYRSSTVAGDEHSVFKLYIHLPIPRVTIVRVPSYHLTIYLSLNGLP